MKVTVTKDDIELGRKNRASIGPQGPPIERCCPVALALGRLGVCADVCTHHIKREDGLEVIMPEKAINWIARWDSEGRFGNEKRVKPFSFVVPL